MLLILLLTACVMAIPIAFEIHYKGSDNLLVRTGKEILEAPSLSRFRDLLEKLGATVLALIALCGAGIALVIAWKVVSWILNLLF